MNFSVHKVREVLNKIAPRDQVFTPSSVDNLKFLMSCHLVALPGKAMQHFITHKKHDNAEVLENFQL